jgi:hypothetical protein
MVLEFDHLRDKIANIGSMLKFAKDKILEEIKKCEIRCANCHRRKTSERGLWSRYKLIEEDRKINPNFYFETFNWILGIGE